MLTSKGCIYRCFNTQNYIKNQNLSYGFILKIFLKFRKFQPRYSYKIYSYKKECSMKQSIRLTRATLYFKFMAFRDLTSVRAGATPQRMFEKRKRHGETDVKVLPWSQWFFLTFWAFIVHCNAPINSNGAHHLSPPLPLPGNRGTFAHVVSPGEVALANFIAARGLGISIPWGDPRAFDTRVFERWMSLSGRTRPLSKTGLSVRD